jgi:hypothetical protein
MGKYLDIIRAQGAHEKNELHERSLPRSCTEKSDCNLSDTLVRHIRLFRASQALSEALSKLERRCPDFVPSARWQQAVKDGQRFLSQWGGQAEALGWTVGDLFGLHGPPPQPHPSYRQLSRYDCTGLVWLLDGRSVVALTAEAATIKTPGGSVLTTYYRRRRA